jgi:glutathione S-transferase
MYTLYIANKIYSSWSLRPWVLMRELAIPFEEKMAPFGASGDYWEDFRRFNPAGKVPCLHHNGEIVWDSMGITEFLADNYPDVWPTNTNARIWARCAAAEMHSGFSQIRNTCPMHLGVRVQLNPPSAALQREITRLNELWSEGLSRFGGPFLAGEKFTAVDAFFAPVVFRIQSYGIPMQAACQAYVEQILALPSMQQWQMEALKETLRDPSHEEEALGAGALLRDLRD